MIGRVEIYVLIGDERSGPYSFGQIRQLFAEEKIKLTDLVWYDGLADWISLQDLLWKMETAGATPKRSIPAPEKVSTNHSRVLTVLSGLAFLALLLFIVVGVVLYVLPKTVSVYKPKFPPLEEADNRPKGSTSVLEWLGPAQEEDSWMVTHINGDICRQVFMGLNPGSPLPDDNFQILTNYNPGGDTDSFQFQTMNWSDVKLDGSGGDFPCHNAWDVSAYAKVAKFLINNTTLDVKHDPEADRILGDLLDLRAETLAKLDVQVSQGLTKTPLNPDLQEEAALLCIAAALRENSGTFYDIRRSLCHAVAHLAIADGVTSRPPTWNHRVATIALSALEGRESDAVGDAADARVEPGCPAAALQWLDALTMKARADWRTPPVTPTSPLLLKIVWFQVMVQDLGADIAVHRLDKLGTPEAIPDWGRAVICADSVPSREMGGRFGDSTIAMEISELSKVSVLEGGSSISDSSIQDVLKQQREGYSSENDESGSHPAVHVLGVNGFGGTARRQLFMELWNTIQWTTQVQKDFTHDVELSRSLDKMLEGTQGYDLVRAKLQNQISLPDQLRSQGRCLVIMDLPVPWLYDSFRTDPDSLKQIEAFYVNGGDGVDQHGVPVAGSSSLGIPRGTAYDCERRYRYLLSNFVVNDNWHRNPYEQDVDDQGQVHRKSAEDRREDFATVLHQMNPDNYFLNEYILKNSSYDGDEQVDKLTHFMDYNIFACNYLLSNKHLQLSDSNLAAIQAKKAELSR